MKQLFYEDVGSRGYFTCVYLDSLGQTKELAGTGCNQLCPEPMEQTTRHNPPYWGHQIRIHIIRHDFFREKPRVFFGAFYFAGKEFKRDIRLLGRREYGLDKA